MKGWQRQHKRTDGHVTPTHLTLCRSVSVLCRYSLDVEDVWVCFAGTVSGTTPIDNTDRLLKPPWHYRRLRDSWSKTRSMDVTAFSLSLVRAPWSAPPDWHKWSNSVIMKLRFCSHKSLLGMDGFTAGDGVVSLGTVNSWSLRVWCYIISFHWSSSQVYVSFSPMPKITIWRVFVPDRGSWQETRRTGTS